MGCLTSRELDQDLPWSIMVEPVPTKNPGIYVTRVVSDVFVRTRQSFRKLSNAHQSSLDEGQGVPEDKRKVWTVMTSGLLGNCGKCEGRGLR